jgi:hypothetical protein
MTLGKFILLQKRRRCSMTRSGWYFVSAMPNSVNMPGRSQYVSCAVCAGILLTHVCSLQSKTSFKNTDQLVKVAVAFVLLDKIGKLFSVHDEVETANLGETEFLLGNAGFVDLPPNLNRVSI